MSAEAVGQWEKREFLPRINRVYSSIEFGEALLVAAAISMQDESVQCFVDQHLTLMKIYFPDSKYAWRDNGHGQVAPVVMP